MGHLSVGPGSISLVHEMAFWTTIPMLDCLAQPWCKQEGLGPASTEWAKPCWLLMGDPTHSEKWMGVGGEWKEEREGNLVCKMNKKIKIIKFKKSETNSDAPFLFINKCTSFLGKEVSNISGLQTNFRVDPIIFTCWYSGICVVSSTWTTSC